MAIGLQLKGSLPDAVSALKAKGVHFQGDVINEGKAGSFIGFEDPDATSSISRSSTGAISKRARVSISLQSCHPTLLLSKGRAPKFCSSSAPQLRLRLMGLSD